MPTPDRSIISFKGAYLFLSNSYGHPVAYEGSTYPSIEQAYQASKAITEEGRDKITADEKLGLAKRTERKNALRPSRDDVKLKVMRDLLIIKFSDPDLRKRLRATGQTKLIDGNNRGETFWGECPIGTGFNNLGKLLMSVRDEIGVRDGRF